MNERRAGLRQTVERISRLSLLFPYEIVEGGESLEQMKQLLQNNKGILIVINHFSERDAIQGTQILLRYLEPYSKKTVMPFAKHHFKPIIGKVLGVLNIEVYPVVDFNFAQARKMLERPLGENKEFKEERRKESKEYLKNAAEALNNGGLVGLVAQATRESKLRPPTAKPVKKILDSAKINTENVAIVCMGVGFSEKTNYENEKIKGFNLRHKFVVKVGRVYSLWKVMKDIKEHSSFETIDHWIHEQLKPLVPAEYR